MFARAFCVTAILALAMRLSSADLQAGIDEGMARYVPWSGSYWPIREGAMIRGPLAKYDQVTGHQAARWELQQNPPDSRVPDWFGYCHAWAAAAVLDREPQQPRTASALDGTVVPFGIGDQKGMLTACHTDDVAQHYGVRFEGQPGEDPQDIYPDQLWRVLRLFIQQRGVPLIVDIEGGTQVWNYPVYAYRVEYRPAGSGSLYFGEMTLWMADDAVPEDIVGVKVNKQTYYFMFELREGAAQLGTGRWVEPSINNHPDFAWYPYVVRAENPELRYEKVQQLVDRSAAGPSAGDSERPIPSELEPTGNAAIPLDSTATNSVVPILAPNFVPQQPDHFARVDASDETTTGESYGGAAPRLLSPVELLDLVTNQTSMFTLDVTVDRFDGGQYVVGDTISIHGTSQRASYLYLFYLDSQGGLSVLFPGPTDANLVPADQRFQIPRSAAGRGFRTANVVGVHRIKAIATSMPLMFSCLSHTSNAGLTDAQTPGSFRLPPSQELMYRDRLRAHLQGKRLPSKSLGRETPADVVGAFAQDEVAFYVGAADTLTSDPGR